MRIEFTQSGGLAGTVKGCRIDSASLPPDDRRRVESLVADSGLAESSEMRSESGRDERQYDIRIEQGTGASPVVIHVVCDETLLPTAARPLVGWLAARSRPQPPA